MGAGTVSKVQEKAKVIPRIYVVFASSCQFPGHGYCALGSDSPRLYHQYSGDSRPTRLNILALHNFNLQVSRLGRARNFWVIRVVDIFFCRRVIGWHRNIRSRFRRWLMSGAIRKGWVKRRFSDHRVSGRLIFLCPLAGLHLQAVNQSRRMSVKI